jgi:hypothetical protein
MIWHFSEIVQNLHEAQTDYTQEDYFDFGENLGDAIFIATQP